MKAVVNGKRYDTDHAELIAQSWNGLGYSDFRNRSTELYRTPKLGKWFRVDSGGPLTDMVVGYGDGIGGSSRLTPITPDQALELLEELGEVDAIDQYFGDRVQDVDDEPGDYQIRTVDSAGNAAAPQSPVGTPPKAPSQGQEGPDI